MSALLQGLLAGTGVRPDHHYQISEPDGAASIARASISQQCSQILAWIGAIFVHFVQLVMNLCKWH